MSATPTRAVIAGRVSTTEQALEGYSIDAQIQKGATYASLHDWEVVGEYRDAGISGTLSLGERPEGARLLKAAKAGEFEVVVWTRLDRFARTVRKALEDFETLNEYGVEVVFIEENIDTTTPMGRLFRTVLLAMAAWEVETIRDRNMSGRYEKAKTGMWPSGQPPIGWEVADDGSLRINEHEAEAVRLAFDLRAEGLPLRTIAQRLREAGHRPRQRRDSTTRRPIPATYGSGAVAIMLARPEYKGGPIIRNISPADGMPPQAFKFEAPAIVTPVIWQAAQDAGARQRAKLPVGTKGDRPYPLAGRLTHTHQDGSTATTFGQARTNGEGEWRIYRCSASRSNTKLNVPATCDGLGTHSGHTLTSVDADYVEAATLLWVLDKLEDSDALADDVQQAEADVYEAVDGPDDMRVELASLKETRRRWLAQYAEGLVDIVERDELISPLNEDIERIEDALERIEAVGVRGGAVLDIGALLDTVVTGDGEDWARDLDEPVGSAEWFDRLTRAATTSVVRGEFRYPKLPPSVLYDLEALAKLLDVHVTVTTNADEPKAPNVIVTYEPLAVVDAMEASLGS